ncbi:MAG: helix-turn-helix domain-containing protein [Rubrivivax sp.]
MPEHAPHPGPQGVPLADLNARRHQAVALRLAGSTLAEAAAASGLSAPTVVAAHQAWQHGGWEAVNVRPRGRKPTAQRALSQAQEAAWLQRLAAPTATGVWSLPRACADLLETYPSLQALAPTQLEGLASRLWQRAALTPPDPWDAWRRAPAGGSLALWRERELPQLRQRAHEAGAQLWALSERTLPGRPACQLAAHSGRGSVWWRLTPAWPTEDDWIACWTALHRAAGRRLWLLTNNRWLARCPRLARWLGEHPQEVNLVLLPEEQPRPAPPGPGVSPSACALDRAPDSPP